MFARDDDRVPICFVTVLTLSLLSLQAYALANSDDAVPSAYRDFQFKHLTIEDGLSQGMINSIYQDRQGFMWFGTNAGLNRYDGYRFTVFRNNPFDSTSLSNDYVQTIFEDRRGRLWIGTGEGLNCFDPASEKFRQFLHDPGHPYSLSDNSISAICEASTPVNEAKDITELWIGTLNGGLNKLVLLEHDASPWELPAAMHRKHSGDEAQAANSHPPEPSQQADHYFVRYQHSPDDPKSLSSNQVWDLLVDQSGVLWIGTNQGLCRLDPSYSLRDGDDQSANFTRYARNAMEASSLLNNECHSMYETRDGSIWIGTEKGLARMAPANRSLGNFENHDFPVELSLSPAQNTIFEICQGPRGALWLATYQGMLIFDRRDATYHRLRHDPGDPASLSYNGVRAVFRDRSDAMWIGTAGFGLSRWDPFVKQFRAHTPDKLALDSDTDLSVHALLEDRRGVMWIFAHDDWYQFNRKTGSVARHPLNFAPEEVNALHEDRAGFLWITNNAGVSRYDVRSNKINKIFPQTHGPKSKLHAIYEDNNGDIWLGSVSALPDNPVTSLSRRHALYHWNRKTTRVTEYPISVPATFKGGWLEIRRIAQDRNGRFWLATNWGLLRFHPRSGALKIFQNEPGNRASLTNNDVKTLMVDPLQADRFLWLGTNGGGLNRLDLANESFSYYMEEHGLSNNVIYGILSDDAGNLWMSTNKGLSKALVMADTRVIVHFKNYDVGDGLQSNEFNTSAYFKNARGEMFFGGIRGFNVFHPGSIREHSCIPPVVFTDFQIRYQSVEPEQPGSLLRKTINTTETITLSPKDNVIAIEFAALDFSAPEKNLYSYKLENFDEGWSQASRRRRVTYTNLEPGRYVLHVRGSNNDGVWNETGASLAIEIKPYFYQTPGFAVLCALVLGLTVYGGYRWRLRYLETRQQELEKQVAEHTVQLRNSKERVRNILDTVVDGIITIDERGRIERANPAAEKIFGYHAEELVGQNINILMPASVAKAHDDYLADYRKKGKKKKLSISREAIGKRKDGSTFPVELAVSEMWLGEQRFFNSMIRDITSRKQAEEEIRRLNESLEQRVLERTAALHDSESRYHVLFDEGPTPLWEIDMSEVKHRLEQWQANGVTDLRAFFDAQPEAVTQCLALIKALDANQAAWRLYQANSKEQLMSSAWQIGNVESTNTFKEQLIAIAEGKTDNQCEASMRTLLGENISIWAHWHVVPGCEQNLSKIFVATIDVTEGKATISELQASREHLRALSAHLQSLREEERLAIARDLHDELGQVLTSLKMDMSMLKRKAKSATGQFDGMTMLADIETMQKLVAGTINKVRSLITELRPEVLDTLGLVPALEWQLQEFHKHTDLVCEFNAEEKELHLSKEHAIAVFRIFQESLTNIARHAHAGKVTVNIAKHNDGLWVEIADDGQGITTEELNAPGKFGLLGMRERALVFGGEVTITGAPARGTTVKIKIPTVNGEQV